MAYTEIHPIKTTLAKAINYISQDKTKDAKADKDDVEDIINYAEADKVDTETVYRTINGTVNCSIKKAVEEFEAVREMHQHKSGRRKVTKDGEVIIAWHLVQSFEKVIDPYMANEIGIKLASERFPGFQCVVSTHTNTKYTHNHIIVNAWEVASGKKYNACNNNYRKIREVSDRLCDEYGLSVIEHTRKQNLKKYKDANGTTRFHEPTERKKKKRQNEFSKTGDYRNTAAFKEKEKKLVGARERVRGDIDELLPAVKSYEQLLTDLRARGYIIKDKKVDGDWRKYVSLKAPGQKGAVRDYMLGDEYTREELCAAIDERLRESERENSGINENDVDGSSPASTVSSPWAMSFVKTVENDTKQLKAQKERIEKSKAHAERQAEWRNGGQPSVKQDKVQDKPKKKYDRHQYLMDCIAANMRVINLVRDKNILSREQVAFDLSKLKEKYTETAAVIRQIESILDKKAEVVALIRSSRTSDSQDIYSSTLTEMGLNQSESADEFIAAYEVECGKLDGLRYKLKLVEREMAGYREVERTVERLKKEKNRVNDYVHSDEKVERNDTEREK